jgi:hypothetical protein
MTFTRLTALVFGFVIGLAGYALADQGCCPGEMGSTSVIVCSCLDPGPNKCCGRATQGGTEDHRRVYQCCKTQFGGNWINCPNCNLSTGVNVEEFMEQTWTCNVMQIGCDYDNPCNDCEYTLGCVFYVYSGSNCNNGCSRHTGDDPQNADVTDSCGTIPQPYP